MPVIGCMTDNGHFCVLILFLSSGYKSVKITLILPILNDTVFLKFTLGKGFCNGRCHFPFMMQHFFLVKLQKRIQPCDPILHIHDVPTACLPLGIIQIHRDDFVQASHLGFVQIILCYHNIRFADSAARCIFPRCQAHIRFRAVCPVIDDLRCGVLCNGVMQFVLYGGEKLFCNRTVHIIVCTALEYMSVIF